MFFAFHLLKMKEDLEVARLNEANLRMEIEQMRLKYDAADSLKLAKQRLRIDSLRRMTTGVPVVVEGDTLYYLFAKRGGHTPQQRAEMNAAAITELGKRFNLQPDSVYFTFGSRQLVARATFPQTILIRKRRKNLITVHQIGNNITAL